MSNGDVTLHDDEAASRNALRNALRVLYVSVAEYVSRRER